MLNIQPDTNSGGIQAELCFVFQMARSTYSRDSMILLNEKKSSYLKTGSHFQEQIPEERTKTGQGVSLVVRFEMHTYYVYSSRDLSTHGK